MIIRSVLAPASDTLAIERLCSHPLLSHFALFLPPNISLLFLISLYFCHFPLTQNRLLILFVQCNELCFWCNEETPDVNFGSVESRSSIVRNFFPLPLISLPIWFVPTTAPRLGTLFLVNRYLIRITHTKQIQIVVYILSWSDISVIL